MAGKPQSSKGSDSAGRESFIYKYILSSLSAVVAESGMSLHLNFSAAYHD